MAQVKLNGSPITKAQADDIINSYRNVGALGEVATFENSDIQLKHQGYEFSRGQGFVNYNATFQLGSVADLLTAGTDAYLGLDTICTQARIDSNVAKVVKNKTSPRSQGALNVNEYLISSLGGDLVAVSPDDWFRAEIDIMYPTGHTGGGGANYLYLDQFDAEKLVIEDYSIGYHLSSVTTLTQDLNVGDTIVHLADATVFGDSTNSFERRFLFWPLQPSGKYAYIGASGAGKEYDELGYTRDATRSDYWAFGQVDTINNTVTLRAPWAAGSLISGNGSTLPAGTKVGRGNTGGAKAYYLANVLTPADGVFHTTVSPWRKGIAVGNNGMKDQTINGVLAAFWNGTSYFKIGGLWNFKNFSGGAYPAGQSAYFGTIGIKRRDGTALYIDMDNKLPTTSSGLASGQIWTDGGVLKLA